MTDFDHRFLFDWENPDPCTECGEIWPLCVQCQCCADCCRCQGVAYGALDPEGEEMDRGWDDPRL